MEDYIILTYSILTPLAVILSFTFGYSWGHTQGFQGRPKLPVANKVRALFPQKKMEVYSPTKDKLRNMSGKEESYYD